MILSRHVHHKAWRARQRPDPTEEIIWDDGFYNNSQDTIETEEKGNFTVVHQVSHLSI